MNKLRDRPASRTLSCITSAQKRRTRVRGCTFGRGRCEQGGVLRSHYLLSPARTHGRRVICLWIRTCMHAQHSVMRGNNVAAENAISHFKQAIFGLRYFARLTPARVHREAPAVVCAMPEWLYIQKLFGPSCWLISCILMGNYRLLA